MAYMNLLAIMSTCVNVGMCIFQYLIDGHKVCGLYRWIFQVSKNVYTYTTLMVTAFFSVCSIAQTSVQVDTPSSISNQLSEIEAIGKQIFFDQQLSEPIGQSCGTCHQPEKAFSNQFVVNAGANVQRFTNRNTPSLAYVAKTPAFGYQTIEGNVVPVGGLFWDGRVDSLEEQALAPFVNPLEMGNFGLNSLIKKIKVRPYFNQLMKSNKFPEKNNEQILEAVKKSLNAYQNSTDFNKFNSKFDLWLDRKVSLTLVEIKGKIIFERIDKGNCAACHTLNRKHVNDQPLLTDFTYDNIGVPVNPDNPYYFLPPTINPLGNQYRDYGLGNTHRIKDQRYLGMFKVPTLRNIELTAPYMHNGVFNTLQEVVEFYNSRDQEDRWGKPEVPYNVNDVELGNLKLTENEIDALVVFMKTLTDDYEE